MNKFETAKKAIEQEISRIANDIKQKAQSIDDQESRNLQVIVEAVADMEAAILSNDSDLYADAAQRKATAEAKTEYFKTLRENLKNHKTEIIDIGRATSLWKDYQAATVELYAKAEQQQQELLDEILKVSKDACIAADQWYDFRKKWTALVGDESIPGIPLVLIPSKKLADPYRKHQLMKAAGIAQQ